jgi:hypothetical protein
VSSTARSSVQKVATQRLHQPLTGVETKMLTPVHRYIHFLMLVVAFAVLPWSSCQAIGSFQTKPVFPSVASADDPPRPHAITWPSLSAGALIGGCGKGRVSDPQTHGCRGPADIRSIAP